MPFSIGAVIVAGLVAGLYVWPPNWSFPQLGSWLKQTATSAGQVPVLVLVVGTPENVEVMRAAVHPDRIVAEAKSSFALDEGRVIATSVETAGESLTAAGWVHRPLEIMLPQRRAESPEPVPSPAPNLASKPLLSQAEALQMLHQLE